MFEKIFELIRAYDTVIIHRHKNPDGDALGSQTGLRQIIKHNYPDKRVLCVGDTSEKYGFICDAPPDTVKDSDYSGALAIILDTPTRSLVSDARYTLADKTARIDHHVFCEQIADVEVTDDTFESCCGLVAALAMECGFALTSAAAKALYTGMITDSGRFRYGSTSSRTFKLASFLMEQSFSTSDIYRNLYVDNFEFMKLRAQFVLKIKFSANGKVAYIYTPREEADGYPFERSTLSRGMVNVMADIRGVDIWVNFTEAEDGVWTEIRSSVYNINPIAKKYGGGGHEKASGATLKDRSTAMNMLADLVALTEITA